MTYDSIIVEDGPAPGLLPAVKMSVEEMEGDDSNGSFTASETGGDVVDTGGLDSAGEEDETEGELMDLS